MIGAVFAAALLLAETTTAAGTQMAAPASAAPAQAAAPAPKTDRDSKICHNEEIVGSRIPKRICFTPAEEEARSQQDRQSVERMQSQMSYTAH